MINVLLLVILAGIINGSYGTPTKYMKSWNHNLSWFTFSIFGFFVLPFLTLFIIPDCLTLFHYLPIKLLILIAVLSIIFGIGQILVAKSFSYIGLGLAFVINISIGTIGATLIPLLWTQGINSTYLLLTFSGVALFLLAVILGGVAGSIRDKNRSKADSQTSKETTQTLRGILYAIAGGIGSALEGTAYIYSNPIISKATEHHIQVSGFAIGTFTWILIFILAGIPFIIYYFYASFKNDYFRMYKAKNAKIYWICALSMGLCFWISVLLYSKASLDVGGTLGPAIVWPMFMIIIIFTSNIWGFVTGEWKEAKRSAVNYMKLSIVIFVLAIILFALSSKFNNSVINNTIYSKSKNVASLKTLPHVKNSDNAI